MREIKMSTETLSYQVKRNKGLIFSFFWLIFIVIQWDIFFDLLGGFKKKLFSDEELLPVFAAIEYMIVCISTFFPIIAVKFLFLIGAEPRLGISPNILGFKYNKIEN
jgi:hypothetical protein